MYLYLGIDGGGSRTKLSIVNEENQLLFDCTSGPSSIDTVSSYETYQAIVEALEPFISQNPNTVFQAVFAGIGGIVFEKDCDMVEALLRQLPQVTDSTFVRARNDMENALYSGNHFDSGIALICGTGMVAFGKNHEKTHKCGGWGYREGELGSSYHLGMEAIRHTIRCFDERLPMDDFAEAVGKATNMLQATDIMPVMDEYYNNRTKTAQLAPIVTKYANFGNEAAKRIVDVATSELALAVRGVYHALQFQETSVVIIGSLGNAPGYFNDQLVEKILAITPNLTISKMVFDPSFAAAVAAKYFSEQFK